MAGGARKIVVEFLGNDKSLGRTAGQVDGKMSRLGGKLKTVGKVAAVGLAAGAVVAGKALFDMGKQAAEDQQQATLLANALKKNAKATDATVKSTERWISAQGKAFGVTDEKLRPALATLVRSTHDVGKAQKLASLAMDISAGTGKDLGAVSAALAKANNGQVAGLARLGIKTKDAAGHTKSFTELQKDLSKTFAGSAKKSADTFSGKMQRLRVMFDEAKESIGYKLLPVAEKLANWFVGTGLPAIQKFSAFLKDKLGPVFDNIRGIISRATNGIHGDVSGNFAAIKSTIASVVSIIQSLWSRFGATIMAYTVATFQNIRKVVGGALQVISGVFKVFSSLLKGDWKGVWDGIKQIFRGAISILHGLVSQLWNIVKSVFRAGGAALKGIVGGIWGGVKSLFSNGVQALVSGVKALPGKLKALGGLFGSAGKSLIHAFVNGMKSAGGVISGIAGNVWSAVKRLLNGAIDKLNSAFNFKISIPGPDIHVNLPNIPHLARGGVVKARPGGTLALLGEAGSDEMVTPLSGRYAPKAGAAAGGDFTVTAPLVIQLDAKNLWQGLVKMKRTNGIVSLGLA